MNTKVQKIIEKGFYVISKIDQFIHIDLLDTIFLILLFLRLFKLINISYWLVFLPIIIKLIVLLMFAGAAFVLRFIKPSEEDIKQQEEDIKKYEEEMNKDLNSINEKDLEYIKNSTMFNEPDISKMQPAKVYAPTPDVEERMRADTDKYFDSLGL